VTRGEWARAVTIALTVSLLTAPVSAAQDTADLPTFTGDEFNQLFTEAELDNLAPIGPAPSITGDNTIDERIRSVGEDRGYIRRPLPAGPLATVDGLPIQPDAVTAWRNLKAAAQQAGHTLFLRSAYRSHATQRFILLRRLTSYSTAAIDYRLRTVATPGYSKHHTGYAIDIAQPGYSLFEFKNSPAYAWLTADNYMNAKRYGWIPSYPPDATRQGPEPEAWEFTFVGVDNIRCFGFSVSPDDRFCDDTGSPFLEDIEWLAAVGITKGCNAQGDRFCPDDPVTRAQMAALVHRALPDLSRGPTMNFTDDDGSMFEADIEWLAATGVTKGCNPPANTEFCPNDPVTRAQMAAFLTRALGLEDATGANPFIDDDGSIFEADIARLAAAGITRGCNPPANDRFCPTTVVTRAQMAAFLRRALDT